MRQSNRSAVRIQIKEIVDAGDLTPAAEYQLGLTGAINNQRLATALRQQYAYSISAARYLSTTARIIKYAYCPSFKNMTCFKVTRSGTTAVYAYLYGDMDFQYVCCGPTFKSQDGEYRSRLLRWDQFERVKEKYSSVFDKVERLILKKLTTAELILHVEFTLDNEQYRAKINESRIAIWLLCAAWLVDYSRIHNKTAENHINPAYQLVMHGDAEDEKTYSEIVAELGGKFEYGTLTYNLKHYNSTSGWKDMNVEAGQKLFPLSNRDINVVPQNMPDIMTPVWREVYAMQLISDLVTNMVTPTFPVYSGWTVINNTHAAMYDNLAMHEKYERSESVKNIVDQLRAVAVSSSKFEHIEASILNTISYAESAVKLSPFALLVVCENVGRTVRDLPTLILNSGIGEFNIFAPDVFKKHLFEWIYGIYVLNINGMMHGDLHLNNVTVNLRWSPKNRDVSKQRTAYIIDGEVYSVPYTLTTSCIIDMSRVVFGDLNKIESDYGALYAEQLIPEQIDRVTKMIEYHFPKFAKKYAGDIYAKLVTDFELVFKAITALDVYTITNNIMCMAAQDPDFVNGNIKLLDDDAKLLIACAKIAEESIISNLEGIFDGRIKTVNFEWPTLRIITELFASYRVTKLGPEKYDIYYARSKMDYTNNDGPAVSKPHGIETDIHSVDYSRFICKQMDYSLKYDAA